MHPLLQYVLDNSVLIGSKDKPVRCFYFGGTERLLTVVGDNASGKSVFRRALSKFSRKSGLEVMHFSPEGRSQGGIAGAIIYGTEEDQSTGFNSARTILKALETARNRENDHIIIFDEPDIGLSDEYAAGAGVEIREFCQACPDKTKLIVVISHRRCLMAELQKLNPSHLSFGTQASLVGWIERETVPRKLNLLRQVDRDMFSAILSARNAHKAIDLGSGGATQDVDEGLDGENVVPALSSTT